MLRRFYAPVRILVDALHQLGALLGVGAHHFCAPGFPRAVIDTRLLDINGIHSWPASCFLVGD